MSREQQSPHKFKLEVQSASMHHKGRIRLTVRNLSDAAGRYQVETHHLEKEVQLRVDSHKFELKPHSQKMVSITADLDPSYRFGPQRWLRNDYDFDVVVSDGQTTEQVRCHLSTAPEPLAWLVILGGLFLLLLCMLISSFFVLEQRMAANRLWLDELAAREIITAEVENDASEGAVENEVTIMEITDTDLAETAVATSPPATPLPATLVIDEPVANIPITVTATTAAIDIVSQPRSYSVPEDDQVTIDLLAGELTDNDRESFLIQNLSTPANGTLTRVAAGVFTYTPNDDYAGTDRFTYEVCRAEESDTCALGTVNLIVIFDNDPPTPNDDILSFVAGDPAQDVTALLLEGDSDPDRDNPSLAIVAVQTTNPERVVFAADSGTIQYDPSSAFASLVEGETTTDSFQYVVEDDQGAQSSAIVTVVISGKNDLPLARNDGDDGLDGFFVVNEGSQTGNLTTEILKNDIDVDSTHQGRLVITEIGNNAGGGEATLSGGAVIYDTRAAYDTLKGGETAIDSFSYTLVDPTGLTSEEATVQITIMGVNDAPELELSRFASPIILTTAADNSTPLVESAVITDVDHVGVAQIVARFTANNDKLDTAQETIELTFQGATVSSQENGELLLEGDASLPMESYILALESAVYTIEGDAVPAICRLIEFHVVDEAGAISNAITVAIEIDGGVCQPVE